MTGLVLALLFGAVTPVDDGPATHGIVVAKRLVAAIKGDAQFQDSDFEKALGDGDKAALRRFAACRVTSIDYLANAKTPTVWVRDFNAVAVMFACKGVSQNTPVGISLHLKDGKVETVETHNADLMRVN